MCGDCEIVESWIDPREVAKLEADLLKIEPRFMDVTHSFNGGLYTRSAKVKRGEILIGAKHRAKNYFSITSGKFAIWDAENGLRVLSAPFSEICRDGTQRLGIALEDSTCQNVLETEKTNWEEVEKEMIYPFTLPTSCAGIMLRLVKAVLGQHGTIQLKF